MANSSKEFQQETSTSLKLPPVLSRAADAVRSRFSQFGIVLGLTLAIPIVTVAALESLLVLRVMESETRAFVQQSIGDTSLTLSAHFEREFEQLSRRIRGSGLVIQQKLEEIRNQNDGVLPEIPVEMLDIEPSLYDISFWNRSSQVSGSDQDSNSSRVYWAVNTRYADEAEALVEEVNSVFSTEQLLIARAFQGETVVTLAPGDLGAKEIALLAVPFGTGLVEHVIVAHLRLNHFKNLLRKESMVTSYLVDEFGYILSHSDPTKIGQQVKDSPLFQKLKQSRVATGQTVTWDDSGDVVLAGFSELKSASLAVLTSVPEKEAMASISGLKRQLTLFLIAFFAFFFMLGYFFGSKMDIKALLTIIGLSPEHEDKDYTAGGLKKSSPARLITGTVIHGSLRGSSKYLESHAPDDAIDSLNEFYTFFAKTIERYDGVFQRTIGTNFIAVWGLGQEEGNEIWKALRCIFDIRIGLIRLNNSRKNEGHQPLYFSMGVHVGPALAGRFETGLEKRWSVAGEILHCAKSLDRMTLSNRVDVLISQEIWQGSDGRFEGEHLGEAKLTPFTGLTNFYSLLGFQNEEGQIVEIEGDLLPEESELIQESDSGTRSSTILQEKKPTRWLVNNGSQIVGPLSGPEIAQRLFAQDLDFDCECWAEGTGTSAQIKSAKIFSGSDTQDEGANLWVYDGEIVHGPLNRGFLKTAIMHGAMSGEVLICEETTVNGWKKIGQWDPELDPSAKPSSEVQPKQTKEFVEKAESQEGKVDSETAELSSSDGASESSIETSQSSNSDPENLEPEDPQKKVA